jgi:hypothetical protein
MNNIIEHSKEEQEHQINDQKLNVLEFINRNFPRDVLTTTLAHKSGTNILLLSFHHISQMEWQFPCNNCSPDSIE